MELEFDNEIDALLRKEVAGRTITISEFSRMHLDADEVAAFAENAVPDQARRAFVEHFAACDMCRKTLSHAITLNGEEALAEGVAAPVKEAVIPWYRRLFLFPNLAYALGGLIILFAGFIGLSVFTYQRASLEVSQVSSGKAVPADSEPVEPGSIANTNAMAMPAMPNNSTVAASNTNAASNTAVNAPSLSSAANTAVDRPAVEKEAETARSDDDLKVAQPRAAEPAPAAAAPPPPAKDNATSVDVTEAPKKQRDERPATLAAERRKETKLEEQNTGRAAQSGPMSAMKKGPSNRTSNERNILRENDYESGLKKSDKTATPANKPLESYNKKQVAGRNFEFHQGAWYDTTYRGQSTINVRRHTDQYKKLDSGLRGIAEKFFGTVVTVWNGRAYRIQ